MAEADTQIITEEIPQVPVEDYPAKPKRRWGRLLVMLSVPIALLVGGAAYWLSLEGQVSTDNAYVKQDKVSVTSQVGGDIAQVLVREGEEVRAGQLLFRIDPEPYRLAIAQADANIASAQANVTALAGSADLSGADISAAREDIGFAQADYARKDALFQRGFLTKVDHEAAQHAVNQARAELRMAEAKQAAARAKLATGRAVPGINPQVAQAQATKAVASLNLRRTEIRAPMAGRVAEADRLQVGNQIVQGLPVLTLVGDGTSYVEANFKETDLAEVRIGQRAEVRFDAYPGVKLKGHVATIGAGTGSEFSVLPAQNATGNWVKVTQRVPVRIAIDGRSPRPLIAGLSTEVTVFTDSAKKSGGQ